MSMCERDREGGTRGKRKKCVCEGERETCRARMSWSALPCLAARRRAITSPNYDTNRHHVRQVLHTSSSRPPITTKIAITTPSHFANASSLQYLKDEDIVESSALLGRQASCHHVAHMNLLNRTSLLIRAGHRDATWKRGRGIDAETGLDTAHTFTCSHQPYLR